MDELRKVLPAEAIDVSRDKRLAAEALQLQRVAAMAARWHEHLDLGSIKPKRK